MSFLKSYIQNKNEQRKKVLSVFLTAGFPDKKRFISYVQTAVDSGADLIEIGIPFSDPVADGPVIQKTSLEAIKNGINIKVVFELVEQLKKKIQVPVILMGYLNPVLKYGIDDFMKDSINAGISGLIIPDLPAEESGQFSNSINNSDIILLTTPLTDRNRIKFIDQKSRGFVYCVSVSGVTGKKVKFDSSTLAGIKLNYETISNNKMLVGFGVSTPDDILQIKNYCDGCIVGSALLTKIINNENISDYISSMNEVCNF